MSAYNKNLDKITERELVYDIVERLKLGKDLKTKDVGETTTILFKAGTYLLDLFKFILSCLPTALLLEIGKVDKKVIYVTANKPISKNFDGEYTSIYRAYSDRLGMDISNAMDLNIYAENCTEVRLCIIDPNTGEINPKTINVFHNDDIITLYLKK